MLALIYALSFVCLLVSFVVQTLPVVPLYGDLQIALSSYVKQSKNYDSSRWTCVTDHAEEKVTMMQYNLVAKMDMIRVEHEQYSSELARFSNEVL